MKLHRDWAILAAACQILFVGLFGAATAAAVDPKNIELQASLDTWVDEAAPEARHDSDPQLVARFDQEKGTRILLAFPLDRLRDAHIEFARLQLTLIEGVGEAGIPMAGAALGGKLGKSTTWKDQPGRTRTFDIQQVGIEPAVVTWDVTLLMRETLEAQGSLHGLALSGPLIASTPPYSRSFASSEDGGKGPSLVVDYLPDAAVRASSDSAATSTGEENGSPPAAWPVRIAILVSGLLLISGALIFWRRARKA